jgi:imidazoleglycerol phosphate synthase glutamine amidotransferase subunit HisH
MLVAQQGLRKPYLKITSWNQTARQLPVDGSPQNLFQEIEEYCRYFLHSYAARMAIRPQVLKYARFIECWPDLCIATS